jgi:putative ABC transport system substrate-binding protein
MRWRDVITLAAGASAWPFTRLFAAEAQRRVGALLNVLENNPRFQWIAGAFSEGLAKFGWVEGGNLRIDYRFSGGDLSRLAA